MPPLVVPQAALVTVRGTTQGRPWANVIGVGSELGAFPLNQTKADAIGAAVRDLYELLDTMMHNTWTMDTVEVLDLSSDTAPSYDVINAQIVGDNAGDPMPSNLALVATHRTGKRGRSYRGRTFLGGFAEATNGADGKASSAAQTNVINAFTVMRTSLAAIPSGGFVQAVVSRKEATWTRVISTACDGVWDHQDRRKKTA